MSLKIKEVKKPEEVKDPKKAMSREERFKKSSRRERKRDKHMGYLEKELQEAAVEEDRGKKIKIVSIVNANIYHDSTLYGYTYT